MARDCGPRPRANQLTCHDRQAKIADRLQTRYTPVLTFAIDRGVKTSIETSRLLRDATDHADGPETGMQSHDAADETKEFDEETGIDEEE